MSLSLATHGYIVDLPLELNYPPDAPGPGAAVLDPLPAAPAGSAQLLISPPPPSPDPPPAAPSGGSASFV